jgi:formylglycine-generating enzyme required for sulfatase activity
VDEAVAVLRQDRRPACLRSREWEYAARGGKDGVLYPWGDKAPVDVAGAENGAAFEGDAGAAGRAVRAECFGLHDMAGNVWEWVSDGPAPTPTRLQPIPRAAPRAWSVWCAAAATADDPSNLRVSNARRSARSRQPQRGLQVRPGRPLTQRLFSPSGFRLGHRML